jgi:hypothetical protein
MCPDCGYDLRGLPPIDRERPCPECGFPAKLYAPPALLLRHAEPAWAKAVHNGLRLQVLSLWMLLTAFFAVLAVLLVGVLLGVAALRFETLYPEWINIGLHALSVVLLLLGLLGVFSHVAGAWLSTAPPHGAPHMHTPARRAARWTGVVVAPLCCLAIVYSGAASQALPPWASVIPSALGIAVASVYLFSTRAWCRRIEFHTGSWTRAVPGRYGLVTKHILGAAGLAVLFSILLELPRSGQERARAPGTGGDPGGLWPIFMVLGYAGLVHHAIAPASRALDRERLNSSRTPARNRKLPAPRPRRR